MKKTMFFRILFYIIGLLVLALGLTLNTKVGLGVSPIISVSFSISTICGLNFGNMTLVLYAVFVLVEILLHTGQYRRSRQTTAGEGCLYAKQVDLKITLLFDVLQFPLSLIFTRFLNLFSEQIPELQTAYADAFAAACPAVPVPLPCDPADRHWGSHVAQHASGTQSRRRDRAGDRRHDRKERRVHQKAVLICSTLC